MSLIINLNSKIVNPVPASPATVAIREQRQLGADRFRAGECISECRNAHQRAGYYCALVIAADCSTYAYLSGGQS